MRKKEEIRQERVVAKKAEFQAIQSEHETVCIHANFMYAKNSMTFLCLCHDYLWIANFMRFSYVLQIQCFFLKLMPILSAQLSFVEVYAW